MYSVTPIAAFNDNYIWLITQLETQTTYVVDPGDADVVIDYLKANALVLDGILITHHHSDHTGGIAALQRYHDYKLCVFGPDNEDIKGITHPISEQLEKLNIDKFAKNIRILHLPGHTLGHIAYLIGSHLFCGDTLFSAGCGRLFEGTPAQMLSALTQLSQLPDATQVYPAHEYTQANLSFALTVDPDNEALKKYDERVGEIRAKQQPSLPTNIGQEKQFNPFLRADEPAIQAKLAQHFSRDVTDVDTSFTLLRQWKDNF